MAVLRPMISDCMYLADLDLEEDVYDMTEGVSEVW